jgi:acyl dehydratase
MRMGHYLEDFVIGEAHDSPKRTITEADVVHFSGLSGDYNPAHTDAVFAATSPIGARTAHGLLILSIATGLSTRLGYLDGTAIAFTAIERWDFKLPSFIGDTIFLRATVIETRRSRSKTDRGFLRRQWDIINQDGLIVQSGFTTLMVKTRASAGIGDPQNPG